MSLKDQVLASSEVPETNIENSPQVKKDKYTSRAGRKVHIKLSAVNFEFHIDICGYLGENQVSKAVMGLVFQVFS